MKFTIIISIVLLIFAGCKKDTIISLKKDNGNKLIALQPLNNTNTQQLIYLKNELSGFFHIRVVVLPNIKVPQTFRSPYSNKYSADSLVQFLQALANDSLVEIVGITTEDIYQPRDSNVSNIKNTMIKEQHSIRGLGGIGGSVCIVSYHSLQSADTALWNNRIRKVILHEIGHNLGLKHCKNDSCLMCEQNGDIARLNIPGGDYCSKCRALLK